MISALGFRNDINGLRTWAVATVVLYHFGIPGFGAGFAGVDIFFVISGFLMTGIIFNGLEKQRSENIHFSILSFYLARARRIFPALIFLCISLIVAGWFLFPMVDYMALGNQIRSSLMFISNIHFWRAGGYFDTASHEKWLLHTWSLSVEWQFYLVLPLIASALWRIRPGRRPFLILTAVCFLASFFASILVVKYSSSSAFYLLPNRAWEMLAGGLVFLFSSKSLINFSHRFKLETIGFGLIILTLFIVDSSETWPGWLALLPVSGTSLILLACRNNSIWTQHDVVQWLGTRSYSIYLWHWPIAVSLTYFEEQNNPYAVAAGLLFTIAIAALSYSYIETTARKKLAQFEFKKEMVILIGTTLILIVLGHLIFKASGVKGRFSDKVDVASNEATNRNPRAEKCFMANGYQSPSCMYGGEKLAAILMGDSHGDAVTTAFSSAVPSASDGIMAWTYNGCPILQDVKIITQNSNRDCAKFFDWATNNLEHLPKNIPVVIVTRSSIYPFGFNESWEKGKNRPFVYFTEKHQTSDPEFLKEFMDNFIKTTCIISKHHSVFLVRPIPEMGIDVPKSSSRAMVFGKNTNISVSLEDYHRRHNFMWKVQDKARETCGVKILDPLPYLCRNGQCYGSMNGRPLYYDDDHLSEFGNRLLIPMFREVFAHPPSTSEIK